MSTKRVLVTGGTGFLGRRLARRLNGLGYQVTATGRNRAAGEQLAAEGIVFVSGDLANRQHIVQLCRGQDCVFHCGALSSPWGKYRDFYEANVKGTQHVIEGVQAHGVPRLVHVSTTSIYFEFRDKFNLPESLPLPARMINDYAATKMLGEQSVAAACRDGVPAIVIRPSGIFGPGDTSILPRLIRANNAHFIPVLADKKVFVDITYVENVVDALLLCMHAGPHALGRVYNITNGEPIDLYAFLQDLIGKLGYAFKPRRIPFTVAYTAAAIIEMLARTVFMYKEPPLTRYTVGILTHSKTLDIRAAREELGYSPRVSIAEGVAEVIKDWKAHACHD